MFKPGSKKAFTGIEIILVILFIGILAAIALPRLGGRDFFNALELRTVTSEVAADIKYARQLAVTNATDYIIRFDLSDNRYDIREVGVGTIDREFPKTIPAGIVRSGQLTFRFQSTGRASTAGTLILTSGTNVSNITVEQITGSVRIH